MRRRAPPPKPSRSTARLKARDRQRGARGARGKDPLARPSPASEELEAPHCLLSALLDEPLLLRREERYTFGRDPSVNVRIKSNLVSRRHAELSWGGRGWVVTDLGALNGTTLNQQSIQSPCLLHDRDRLGIGGFEFVVRVAREGFAIRWSEGHTRVFELGADQTSRETPSFAGDLSQLGLRDVIEILEWKQNTGTLRVETRGDLRGELCFERGRLTHAAAGRFTGSEAALELLAVRQGHFSFSECAVDWAPTVTRSLDELWGEVRGR